MNKFKAGETLKITGQNGHVRHYLEAGDLVKVISAPGEDSELNYFVERVSDNKKQYVSEVDLQSLSEKFKVGDKVTVAAAHYHNFDDGTTGEIVTGNSMIGNLEVVRVKDVASSHYQVIKIEDVKPFEQKPAFKAGVKVKLLSGGGEFPLFGFRNGETYMITGMPGDYVLPMAKHSEDGRIQIQGGGHFGQGYALPEQLELAAAAEPQKELPFKKGEIVQVTSSAFYHMFDPGTIGKVVDPDRFNDGMSARIARLGDDMEQTIKYGDLETVERYSKEGASVGDLIVPVEEISFLTVGKEYQVKEIDSCGDAQILDDDGDSKDLCGEHGYFIKVGFEDPTPEAAEEPKDRYTKAEAAKGDVIRLVEDALFLTVGKTYTVEEIDEFGDAQITDDDGDELDLCGKHGLFVKVGSDAGEEYFLANGSAPDTTEDRAYKVIDKEDDAWKIIDDANEEQWMYPSEGKIVKIIR